MRVSVLSPASDERVAAQLFAVQRAAYLVEAGLIGDDRIPPLHEDLADLRAAPLTWLGVVRDAAVVGAAAVRETADLVELDRLVVAPDHHRQGVGTVLVTAVLELAGSRPVEVSTGRDNAPARRLYERSGFIVTGDEEVLPGLWVTHLVRGPRPAGQVLSDPCGSIPPWTCD